MKKQEELFNYLQKNLSKFSENMGMQFTKATTILENDKLYTSDIKNNIDKLASQVNSDNKLKNKLDKVTYASLLFDEDIDLNTYILNIESTFGKLYKLITSLKEESIENEEIERKIRAEKFRVVEEKKKADDNRKIRDLEFEKKYKKKIFQKESLDTIKNEVDNNNNKYLSGQYIKIKNNITLIKELKITITRIKDENIINDYKNELKLKEKQTDTLINDSLEYISETEKIDIAIKHLQVPSKSLKKEKKLIEKRRKLFNQYATYLFRISGVFFACFILFFYLGYIFEFEYLKKEKIEFTIYLFAIFPIIFTTLLSLLILRQANLKSKELIEINKRFLLIDEINQSMRALVEIYRGKDMNDKTEIIIDKLIENILHYASDSSRNNENYELLDTNKNFDNTIDSIDKKMNAMTNALKSAGIIS